MALTSRSSNISRIVPDRVKSILINDVSGSDTGAVTLNLVRGGTLRIEPVTAEINYGTAQVLERITVQFDIPDIMSPQTGQFVHELTSKVIPRVKLTMFDGTVITLDSGDNNLPILIFAKELVEQDGILVWRLTGTGYKSKEADLNTTT